MRESVIETLTVANLTTVGNVTGTAGSTTITGTGFNSTFSNINIAQTLEFIDDTGRLLTYAVASRTNDTTLELFSPLKNAVTGNEGFTQNYQSSPWVIQPDPKLQVIRPDRLLIYGSSNNNLYGGTNFSPFGGDGDYQLFRLLSPNEGILLKSIYMTLPYQYTMSGSGITVEMRYTNTENFSTAISGIGTEGRLQISQENVEIPINQYIRLPTLADEGDDYSAGWGLSMSILDASQSPVNSDLRIDDSDRFGASFPSISRVNAPESTDVNSDLENTFLPIKLGARIVHLNPLTVANVNDVNTI